MARDRNAPCPCGSNRKFKKCCLPLHQRRSKWDSLEDRLRMLIKNFETEGFYEEYIDAAETFGIPVEGPRNIQEGRLFMDWYIHDYELPSKNDTIIHLFLKRRGRKLDDMERETVRAWADATFRLYEITDIRRGVGFNAKDVFGGEECFAFDVSGSESLSKYDILFARLYRVGDIVRLSGGGKNLPHAMLDRVREFVEHALRHAGHDPTEAANINSYFRKNSLDLIKYLDTLSFPRPVVTAEGDVVVFSEAHYMVSDSRKVLQILASSEQFVDLGTEDGMRRFDWVTRSDGEIYTLAPPSTRPVPDDAIALTTHMTLSEEGGSETVKVLGNLSVGRGRLVVECMSEQRLHECKKVVEDLLSGLVRHTHDHYRDSNIAGSEEGPPEDDDAEEMEITPEALEETSRYFESYYERWLNTPNPGLGNVAPLEACRTAEGHRRLDGILRDMENMRSRRGDRVGYALYPVEKLKDRLGMQ